MIFIKLIKYLPYSLCLIGAAISFNSFFEIKFILNAISSIHATFKPCLFSIEKIKLLASSKLEKVPVSNQTTPLPKI